MISAAFGYRKWRKHYGDEHGLLGYWLRYATGKRATEDPFAFAVLKMLLMLIWALICGFIFIR